MKVNSKLIVHLIGFLLAVPISYYIFNIRLEIGLKAFITMSIGYLFCFFTNNPD
jgi:hypothetical protein